MQKQRTFTGRSDLVLDCLNCGCCCGCDCVGGCGGGVVVVVNVVCEGLVHVLSLVLSL